MTLSIIAGKPGSGKTYHMSSILVDMLTDWARYEIKHWDEEKQEYISGELYPSSVWTNIVYNEEGLNETISKRVGQEVDVWKYMNYCDEDFFRDAECIYWWKKFPAQAVVIIDEVHFHLGVKVEHGSLDLEQELINWISTHRHTQQVLYFLTQHTDQFANQVLGVADLLLEIVNLKSLYMPFPINVPMSDFDEVKRAFGILTQYYRSNVGNFRGKAIKWTGASEQHLMSPDVFRVYQSHAAGMESSDRPSLKMSPVQGLLWFGRRHAWHLVPKIACVISIPYVFCMVFMGLPNWLASAAVGVKKPDEVKQEVKTEVKPEENKDGKNASVVKSRVAVSESVASPRVESRAVSLPAAGAGFVTNGVDERVMLPHGERVAERRVEEKKAVKIVMLYKEGVMLNDGRKISYGETLEIEGNTETLSLACPVCGVIVFESGKRIKF